MTDFAGYHLLTAGTAAVLFAAAAAGLCVAVRFVRRSVPGAASVAVGAGLLGVPPAAVFGWALCRATGSRAVPAWWFCGPDAPEVVLLCAGCVVIFQVLLAIGLTRAWRAYDAAGEARPDRARDGEPR